MVGLGAVLMGPCLYCGGSQKEPPLPGLLRRAWGRPRTDQPMWGGGGRFSPLMEGLSPPELSCNSNTACKFLYFSRFALYLEAKLFWKI